MKSLLFVSFILWSKILTANTVSDPYQVKIQGPPTHLLKMRVINHGVKDALPWVTEQISAAEIIYSQCENVTMKVEITAVVEMSLTKVQDRMFTFANDNSYYSQPVLDLLQETFDGKKSDVLDVHLVDYLDARMRGATSAINMSRSYGVAFNPNMVDWIFLDPRRGIHPPLVELAGNVTFLAVDTVRLVKNDPKIFWKTPKGRAYSRILSLLAHEAGHILLDSQMKEDGNYKDHWCVGLEDYCPAGNILMAGGNRDEVWKHTQKDEIIDYDPLPTLEVNQCETLINHPAVKKI